MPIHEKSLIRPENLKTHENLSIDGVDVSGHWSTFIESRVITDYNDDLQDEIAARVSQARWFGFWSRPVRPSRSVTSWCATSAPTRTFA